MNGEERHFEDNVARLMQAGLGEAARLSPQAKEQAWRRLVNQLRTTRAAIAFPDRVLILLTGVLGAVAAWLAVETFGLHAPVTMSAPLLISTVLLTCNLLCVPLAGIVIVRRRRYA